MFFATQAARHGFEVGRQITHHCSSKNIKSPKGETVENKRGENEEDGKSFDERNKSIGILKRIELEKDIFLFS